MRFVLPLVWLAGCAGAPPVPGSSPPAHRHNAVIDHTWPKPARLPELPPHLRSTLERPVLVIPQLGPQRATAASKAERERLTKLAARTKGTTRLAALDRLADALESDSEDEVELVPATAPAIAAYLQLVAEPGFDRYAKADEVLFRAAHLLFEVGRMIEAQNLVTQLLTHYPTSKLVADAHVLVADNLQGDPMLARAHYEEAIATGRNALADYARLHHATLLTQLGEYAGALADCDQVAAGSTDLRQPAAQTCVTAFAQGGALANARDYFTRLDPDSVADSLRRLARAYFTLGKAEDAIGLLEDTLLHVTEPDDVCEAHARLFEARVFVGARVPILVEAKVLAQAAQPAPVCRVDADDQLGDLAWTWQLELPKSGADPRQVDELWQDELAVVTTDARRAVALLDHAYLVWALARSERRPAAWDRAAAALQAAYDAEHDSVELEAIASARANAAALRTSP